MLGKRPRPFLRTPSKPQLAEACYTDEPPDLAEDLGAPQHVVIGFDVGGTPRIKPCNPCNAWSSACDSPRSVLEAGALSDSSHYHNHQSSPHRFAMGTLLSGAEAYVHKKGLGCMRAEVAVSNTICEITKAISITEHISQFGQPRFTCTEMRQLTGGSYHVDSYSDIGYGDNDDEKAKEDCHISNVEKSNFCASTSFSNCYSLDFQAVDFLSLCYFCKCQFKPGKDIFMYRGDRAFCSVECRYQHIVIDESKERCSVGGSCSPAASSASGK